MNYPPATDNHNANKGSIRGGLQRVVRKTATNVVKKMHDRLAARAYVDLHPGADKKLPESFTYTPVDSSNRQIRLLRILPAPKQVLGKKPEPIRCELCHVSLDARPKYTALSYTWGEPGRFPIWINGRVLHVGENLIMALRWLREHNQPDRYLWIDAVCICQRDLAEKSAQVSMMGQIYRSADEVLVWLGSNHGKQLHDVSVIGEAAEAIGIRDINGDINGPDNRVKHRELSALMNSLFMRRRPPEPTQTDRDVISFSNPSSTFFGVFQSPWFTRVWVLQEVALARKAIVAAGVVTAPFEFLVSALRLYEIWLQSKPQQLVPTGTEENLLRGRREHNRAMMDEAIKDMRPIYREPPSIILWKHFAAGEEPLSLHKCLFATFVLCTPEILISATDPRDTMYSLLDISSDARSLGIKPDYQKPAQTLFVEGMLILCRGRRLVGLPLWVPDWTAEMIMPWNAHTCFWASGDWVQAGMQLGPLPLGSMTLTFQAVEVGRIVNRGSTWAYQSGGCTVSDSLDDVRLRFEEVELFLRRSSRYAQEDFAAALWRIPIGNKEKVGPSPMRLATEVSYRDYVSMRNYLPFYNFSASVPPSRKGRPSGSGSRDEITGWWWYHDAMRLMKDSCPVLLSNGCVGLAPGRCQVDDIVIIPLGMRMPFVVRSVDNVRGYVLIGEAYVHGIMHGEFMEEPSAMPHAFVLV